jgi:hypothetical protein
LVALKKQEKKVNYIWIKKEKTHEAKNSIDRELKNRIECKNLELDQNESESKPKFLKLTELEESIVKLEKKFRRRKN